MKIKYLDLDSRFSFGFANDELLRWHLTLQQQHLSTFAAKKLLSARLQREGERISDDLGHNRPSMKWYRRFLVRRRFSLPRPKRQYKIPIDEAHRLAHSFYTYLRRASTWATRRGLVECFTGRDVFNMDESPLALFGEQTKTSINDVNTCNKTFGHLSEKINLF